MYSLDLPSRCEMVLHEVLVFGDGHHTVLVGIGQRQNIPLRRKEGNVLFNDTLNTFYLWLYGIRHMIKDHSDSEKGNPLPPHRLLFPISSKGSFICIIPDRIAHTTAFVTPVVKHWLEREIAQWLHPMKDRSDDPSHHERTLLPRMGPRCYDTYLQHLKSKKIST